MKPSGLKLSGNASLAIAGFVLALLVLLSGETFRGKGIVIDPKELAFKVENELDHVTAFELARWIMIGRKDFLLIDLRDASEFASYHIPGAQNLSLTSLVEAHFDKQQSIVLYSEGGVHSAQAMFLLWTQGFKSVFMLKGGINEWNEEVVHPVFAASAKTPSARDSLDELKSISRYFGGDAGKEFPHKPIVPNSGKEREKTRDEC